MCSDFIFNLFPLPLSSEKKDLRVFGDFFPPPTNLCSGALYFTLQLILISFMIRGRLDLQNSGTSFMMSCIPSMKAGWHFLQCSLFSCLFFGFVSFTDRFTDKPHWMPTTPLWGNKAPENWAAAPPVRLWCHVPSLTAQSEAASKKINDGALWLLLYGFFGVQAGCTGGGALDLSNLDEMLNSDATRTFICQVEVSCLIFHFYSSRWGNVVF